MSKYKPKKRALSRSDFYYKYIDAIYSIVDYLAGEKVYRNHHAYISDITKAIIAYCYGEYPDLIVRLLKFDRNSDKIKVVLDNLRLELKDGQNSNRNQLR